MDRLWPVFRLLPFFSCESLLLDNSCGFFFNFFLNTSTLWRVFVVFGEIFFEFTVIECGCRVFENGEEAWKR
jgi:hypothetical protein